MYRSLVAAAATLTLLATACAVDSGAPVSSAEDELTAVRCKVEIVSSSLGNIYANVANHSLYTFDNDVAGESTCYDACATRWPALLVQSSYGIPAPFGVTTRTDGTKQLTVDGKPLYTFANDTAPGDVKGEGIGGVWHLARPAAAKLADSSEGEIYVDALGLSLYTFDNDVDGESTCHDACAARWPALIVPSERGIEAPFGVTTRPDGKKQVTLDGKPLYTFANDAAPGDVNGDGIGGVWHLARPTPAVEPAPEPAPAPAPAPSSPYSY